ncbi:MAG: alpha-L-arabinofuranosidase C-terminal domain-containing protein [Desulfurococcaceae archaeon]
MKTHVYVDTSSIIAPLDRRIYGQFVEHLGKCIYGGIWVGENSKIPNVKGYRLDVLNAVKEIKPPLIRWPGGNFVSQYHWMDGIGPREHRPRRFELAWGQEEPNEFGTDEYIEWIKMIGAEPYIVVNAGNGTPEEAAAWVEYCNSPRDTYYASLRKKYGHKEPYNVKLWGIGNELYGRWQVGFCKDGEECGWRTVEFADHMRRVDPTIKLVAVGVDIDPEWNVDMIRIAGEYIDYLSIHTYIFTDRQGKTYEDLVAWPVFIEENLRSIYYVIEQTKFKYRIKRDIKIIFDEWNVWYPEAQPPYLTQITSVKDAVFTGLVLNSLQRLVKIVPAACFAQTVNVLPLIITDDEGKMILSPQYLVFKLYTEVLEGNVVTTIASSPAYRSKELDREIPYLDASAVFSSDKTTLYLYVVNRHPEESAEIMLHIKNFKPSTIRHKYVAGTSINDKNTFDKPDNVKIEEKSYALTTTQTVSIPPHSVNLLILS